MRTLRIPHFISKEQALSRRSMMSAGMTLLLCATLANGQSNLGALLDAGAKRVSAQEFRQELVGTLLEGPTQTGSLEVFYFENGAMRGSASITPGLGHPAGGGGSVAIEGNWMIDDGERVCASMRIGTVVLAPSCHFWFKHDQQYFLSVSDSDRRAPVLRRTVKK